MRPLRPIDSTSRSLAAVIAVVPIGFVAGLAAMHDLVPMNLMPIGDEITSPVSPIVLGDLVGPALVVAVLGAGAASVAGASARPATTMGRALLLFMLAAILCTPATLTEEALKAYAHDPSFDLAEIPSFLAGLVLVTLVGLMFSVPLGLAFSAVYTGVLGAIAAAREHGGYGRHPLATAVIGAAWILTGAPLRTLPGAGDAALGRLSCADLLAIAGVVLVLGSALRLAWLAVWILRVARGALPDHRIEPATDSDADLPPFLPGWSTGGVLVHEEPDARGPFRSGQRCTRLARSFAP